MFQSSHHEAPAALVDDQHVGTKGFSSVIDDGGTKLHHLCDVHVQAKGRILTVSELDDARYPDEIDSGSEIETADDRRPGEDQNRQVLAVRHQRVRNTAAAPEVAQTKGVVAVDQNARAFVASWHHHNQRVVSGIRPTRRLAACSASLRTAAAHELACH